MNATDRIRELAEERLLSNREFDGVGFIDRLLQLAQEVGEIRATLVRDGVIRFQATGHAPCDVPVERAKSKLRMLCARLAVLCQESGGEEILYGGKGMIRAQALTPSAAGDGNGAPQSSAASRSLGQSWSVRHKNTMSEQEFTITAN